MHVMISQLSGDVTCISSQVVNQIVQGGFFNWDPPKNHKYWNNLKYPNWDPPKNHKYGKKLKYPNWDPPKISKYGKHI